MSRKLPIACALVALLSLTVAAPASAARPDCFTGVHVGDLTVRSTCRIPIGATLDGDFRGFDDLYVIGGHVTGDVIVKRGSISLAGSVDGKVVQRGDGDVTLWGGARVEGNVVERGVGDLRARDGASVGGSFSEYDWGMLKVTDATIEGHLRSDPEPPHPVPEPGKSFCQVIDPGIVLGKLRWACAPGFYDVDGPYYGGG